MRGWLVYFISFLLVLSTFAIAEESEFETVRFAVIGDRTGSAQPGVYEEVLEQIERLKPEFIITVGDMIEGYTEDTLQLQKEWAEYNDIVADLSAPLHLVTGNHDIYNDVMDDYYRKHIGQPYYSFDYRGIHVIVLQNGRWSESSEIPAEQISWLGDDLKANQGAAYTLAFMHKPFWYNSTALGEPDTLHSLFKTYGVDAVFCGHFHVYFTAEYDGIIYTTVGSSGGGMDPGISGLGYHFCWVTVDRDGFAIAPIEKDAVRAWDDVTADDLRLVTRMEKFGMECGKVAVSDNLGVENQTFTLTINNFSSGEIFENTLTWNLPAGWKVMPGSRPVKIEPNKDIKLEFTATCTGDLYPLPKAAVNYDYKTGRKTEIDMPLLVARQVECLKAGKKVKIDGDLKEDVWQSPVTRFFSPSGGKAETDPVEFFFAYDDKNLYWAARCVETKPDSMVARVKERDGAIYAEDCVGYFFQPDIDSPVGYQIYINPLGTVFDQKLVMDSYGFYSGDRDWNGEYKIKAKKTAEGWVMEAALPLDQFGISGEPGKKCGINFRRKQKRLNSAADWQEIDSDVKTYGDLIMK